MSHLSDYTIGWICAIRIEFVAACELLDDEYTNVPVGIPHGDTTSYKFGRMGEHHVVIACLPAAKYGMVSAASVAIHMDRTFPSIMSSLMVGIAGGAPSAKADVRLGDVVVGMPDEKKRETGVICYRRGRDVQNQPFQRTGMLQGPPNAWLSAVGSLQTEHARKGHRISETVTAILSRNRLLVETCSRPDSASEILFRPTLIHRCSDKACVEECVIAQEDIVFRKDRKGVPEEPFIHYGLIASSDALLKNAIVRDALSSELGVLCVEMEAAGLMDNLPCLVIRGICDYADTHKNDAWQGYAAVCAAAYAKELVNFIRGGRVATAGTCDVQQIAAQALPRYKNPSKIEPNIVETAFSTRSFLFDRLSADPLYMISDSKSVWTRLTLYSWLTYEAIFEEMSKDSRGRVSCEFF